MPASIPQAPSRSPRGVGRPAQTEVEIAKRRQELISAASEVFAEKGFHDAGITDITSRLSIGYGTFYRHFTNKRDILDHVLDAAVRRITAALALDGFAGVESAAEFRVQLSRFGDDLFTLVAGEDPHLLRLLLLDSAAIDQEFLQRLLGLMEGAVAATAATVRHAKEQGFLRPTLNPESLAVALIGCAAAGALAEERAVGMGPSERRRYVDTLVSMLCDDDES